MKRHKIFLVLLAILASVSSSGTGAAVPEARLALVIGNAAYKTKPLATSVSDAALVAQTLQSAGFEVVGARDLDQVQLRGTFRDFITKVAKAGPTAVVVVYFSGYGAQLAGENYLIPTGAEISDVTDLPIRALSLSELTHALAPLSPKSTFVVIDAARPSPFVLPGQAGGLAWTEPEANMLIAFSAAPGTTARDAGEGYGPYAKAFAEMIREGDLTPDNLFNRVRLRVHELTKGAQIPWNASKIEAQFKFLERTPGAPARTDMPARSAELRFQPMRALGVQNAYMVALMRDTFDAYTDFLADYWQDPLTKRVRALLAARRESITWQRTCQVNEPTAYWSYLERYPMGPHVADAGRLLTRMGAPTTPPSKFARMDYDVPPPLPDEAEYIERPMLVLDDPALGFESPPPTPANFLEPTPQELLNLKPPVTSAAHALPALNLPLPVFLRIPTEVNVSQNPPAREAWVMKPAIDVPRLSPKQVESALSSRLTESGNANDFAKGTGPLAPVATGSTQNDSTPSPKAGNQGATNEFSSRLAPSPPVKSATPHWLIDTMTARNVGAWPLSESDMLKSGPSMFASASAGLTFQTWNYGIPSSRVARSGAPARPRAALSGEASSAATLSPRNTPNIPKPTGRSATPLPTATGSLPRTSAGRIESPSMTADQAKPKKPSISRPLPLMEAGHNSNGVGETKPLNPQ